MDVKIEYFNFAEWKGDQIYCLKKISAITVASLSLAKAEKILLYARKVLLWARKVLLWGT